MGISRQKFGSLQVIKNISSNIFIFLINLIVGFWYIPYLIRNLGSELFSFVPLTDSVTNFFVIITLSLNTATGRYLTIELENENTTRANQMFNTTVIVTTMLIILIIPIGFFLIILVPHIFNVPLNHVREVQYLFAFSIGAFFFKTFRNNFSIASFVKNRFDLNNIVTLGARIGQIVIVILLFRNYPPNLILVGIGTIGAGLFALLGEYSLWKRLLPELKVCLDVYKREFLRILMGTSIWVIIYNLGFIIFINTDMVVANRTLDLRLAGMFGALLIIPKNLRIMANTVGKVWGPSILSKYSKSDYSGMIRIVMYSVKLIGITLALPVGLIAGLAKPFLIVWLGPKYEIMSWVLVVMIIHLSVTLVTMPYFNVQVALNKIKFPALLYVIFALTNFFLAVGLAHEFGPIGIVISSALLLFAKDFIITPIYTAIIMDLAWWKYMIKQIPIILITIGVFITSNFFSQQISFTTLLNLIFVGIGVTCVYIVFIYFFGVTEDEKKMVKNVISPLLRNRNRQNFK